MDDPSQPGQEDMWPHSSNFLDTANKNCEFPGAFLSEQSLISESNRETLGATTSEQTTVSKLKNETSAATTSEQNVIVKWNNEIPADLKAEQGLIYNPNNELPGATTSEQSVISKKLALETIVGQLKTNCDASNSSNSGIDVGSNGMKTEDLASNASDVNDEKHWTDENPDAEEVLVKEEPLDSSDTEVGYDYEIHENPISDEDVPKFSVPLVSKPDKSTVVSIFDDGFQCLICDSVFDEARSLDEHVADVHMVKNAYDCLECMYWAPSVQDLLAHVKVHKRLGGKSPIFRCIDCADIFLYEVSMKDHKCHIHKNATQIEVYNADDVPLEADASAAMFSSCLPLTCRFCWKKFATFFLIDNHYQSKHSKLDPYNCYECTYKAKTYRNLERHSRLHKILGKLAPHVCEQCKDIFINQEALQRHTQQDHISAQYPALAEAVGKSTNGTSQKRGRPRKLAKLECTVCAASFKVSTELDKHYSDNHDIAEPYGCRECKFRTATYTDLESHVMTHLAKKFGKPMSSPPKDFHISTGSKSSSPYKCPFCPLEFEDVTGFESHTEDGHREEDQKPDTLYSCHHCTFECKDFLEMKRHLHVHVVYFRKKDLHHCKECNLAFQVSVSFEKHQKEVHDNPRPYRCELCGFLCAKLQLYKGHLKRHTKPYPCTICGNRFAERCDLRVHMLSHGTELPFKCNECDRAFKLERLLRIHNRLHTNERPYSCKQCDKKYFCAQSLRYHVKSKHVDRPGYMCEICGKGYPTSGHLARHKMTHSDVTPYQCEICPKAFKRMEHLQCHRRMHTGEQPYECRECGKRFKQICGLQAHKKVHTGEKPYVCKVCKKAFTYSSSIKNGTCTRCRSPADKLRYKRSNEGKVALGSVIKKRRKRKNKYAEDSDSSDMSEDMEKTELPYGCDRCDKRFPVQAALDSHMSLHQYSEDTRLSEKDVMASLLWQGPSVWPETHSRPFPPALPADNS